MKRALFYFLFIFMLSGCGVSVIPLQVDDSTATIVNNTISLTRGGIGITAKFVDVEIPMYQVGDRFASVYIVIKNFTGSTINLPLDSFLLVGPDGSQYSAIEPNKLIDMLGSGQNYLIPYPFVGYYYLTDRFSSGNISRSNTMTSYVSNRSQNYLLDALPIEPIINTNQISGLLYFNIDLYTQDKIYFRVYQNRRINDSEYIEIPFEVKK